ncbi:hypothetical protein LARI1_G004277 [Lachnellula arida]|uniref:Uncharacterized protein n=1 Tax=Lachnellula arida TaxID=1316785 RepID=A0A8T9BE55_9HELO|nr:hypothetical protein LARI1_G004277 [Lachnellula arida]
MSIRNSLDLKRRNGESLPPLERAVIWPPEGISSTPLGEIRDASGNWYPRDIGRSSVLGDAIIFQFGDTFSHEADGTFQGVSSNTAALVTQKSNPTLTVYASHPRTDAIPTLIPLTRKEDIMGWKIWSFSGTVEFDKLGNGDAFGWTWFQMMQKQDSKTNDWVLKWTGIAKTGKFDVALGRVKICEADDKTKYKYWTSHGGWTSSSAACGIVFEGMVHGQVFKTKMFGGNSPYQWAFIGCNSFADSKIQMGRAERPEGPWVIHELMGTYRIDEGQGAGFTYCMASDEKKGDLCVSWSEGGMTGGVLASMSRLKTAQIPHGA